MTPVSCRGSAASAPALTLLSQISRHRCLEEALQQPWPRQQRLAEARACGKVREEGNHHPQPSLSSFMPLSYKSYGQKRKRLPSDEPEPSQTERAPWKKRRASPESVKQVAGFLDDPVAHWAATGFWPKTFGEKRSNMGQRPPSKRRSTSKHESDRLGRLSKHGVFMMASNCIQQSSKGLCLSFLEGGRTPRHFPCYPPDQIANVLVRIQPLNEARLFRDITPWIAPSAENLQYSGEAIPNVIGEELQADWIRCATMGETRPKPDYTAGLLRKAFTQEEVDKLENYASFERPWLFTPNLCFPFLMCEAKTGLIGLEKADRQNIHSASITVNAIFELYKAAFGTTSPDKVKELDGQVLAFFISHNNQLANLYGHYAVLRDDAMGGLDFYRHGIKMFSWTMDDGADRYKSYNFVLNLYREFAPKHQQRIKDAVPFLPTPVKRTGLSFTASELTLEEMDSQQVSQAAATQDDSTSQRPADRPACCRRIKWLSSCNRLSGTGKRARSEKRR